MLLQPMFIGRKLKTLLDTPITNITKVQLVGRFGMASFRIELRHSLKLFEFTPIWVEDWIVAFRNAGIPVVRLARGSVLNKAKYYLPRLLLAVYLIWVVIAAIRRFA